MVMLALLAGTLAGCGRSNPEAKTEQNPPPPDAYTKAPPKTQQGTPSKTKAKKETPKTKQGKDVDPLKAAGLALMPGAERKTVKVSSNNLTEDGLLQDKVVDALKQTPDIVGLNFVFTRLSNDGLAQVARMSNLRELRIGDSRVTNEGLVHLKSMPQLDVLAIYGLEINDDGLKSLSGLTSLQELRLGGSLIGKQDVSTAGLGQLKLDHLRELRISRSNIGDDGLALLKNSIELTHLDADQCPITDVGLAHLKPLGKLTRLSLKGSKVSNAGLANLSGLQKLYFLNLERCKGIDDAGLAHLESLSELGELRLNGTGVSKAAAGRLKEKLPKCAIEGDGWEIK